MKKRDVAKLALELVATIGSTIIVAEIIKSVLPVHMRILTKIVVGVGTVVLVNIVNNQVATYVDAVVDAVADSWEMGVKLAKEAKETI